MSSGHLIELSVEQLERIDSIVAQFEAELHARPDASIQSHLQNVPHELRPGLLAELIASEVEFLRAQGESPVVEDYLQRYAADADAVDAGFAEIRRTDPTGTLAPRSLAGGPHHNSPLPVSVDTEAFAGRTEDTDSLVPRQPISSPTTELTRIPAQFGRYRIERLLGEGGMGAVYLATDTQLQRQVALKVPKFDPHDQTGVERFLREARAMAMVEHTNLCPIHDVGEIDGRQFLTMAYIDGPTLAELLKSDRSFSPGEATGIVGKLATALQVAHDSGIVHRDLKPANVLINPRGEPVITDFGLARRYHADDETLTQEGMIVGSPAYMAPEQVDGDLTRVGAHTDVYALGAMLYEMLCGRRPYEGSALSVLGQIKAGTLKPIREQNAAVAPELAAICARAMATNVDNRFPTAASFAESLEAYASGAKTDAPSFARRASAAALFLLAAVACAVYVIRTPQGTVTVMAPDDAEIDLTIRQDGNEVKFHSRPGGLAAGGVAPSGSTHLRFVKAQEFRVTHKPDAAFADVNGDGRPDLVVARSPSVKLVNSADAGDEQPDVVESDIRLNDGKGMFTLSPHRLPTASRLAFGDVDSDGDQDVWLSDRGQSHRVFLNDGGGRFTDSGERFEARHPYHVLLVDLDNDQDPDAFVANGIPGSESELPRGNQVFLNDGHGRFTDSGQAIGDDDTQACVAFDADADGDIDICCANRLSGNQVWLNDGQAGFSRGPSVGADSECVAAGDLDSDGDVDLISGDVEGGSSVWLNDGRGLFSRSPTAFGPGRPRSLGLADLDGDGDLDAIVGARMVETDGDHAQGIANSVWWNDGRGGFGSSTPLPRSGRTLTLLHADIDGDGDPDLCDLTLSDGRCVVLRNHSSTVGRPNFIDSGLRLGNSYSTSVVAGDLDADGFPDAVVGTNSAADVMIYWNDGDSGFVRGRLPADVSLGRTGTTALGDLDGDGDLDIFLARSNGMPDLILLNEGDRNFRLTDDRLGDASSSVVVLGDLDGDQDLDVWVTSRQGRHGVWINNGRGRFSKAAQPVPASPRANPSVSLADFDLDGDLDVLTKFPFDGQETDACIGWNDGSANFTLSEPLPGLRGVIRANTADFDGDGRIDVAAVVRGAGLVVLHNRPDGWEARAVPDSRIDGQWQLAVADVNGDTWPDLAVAVKEQLDEETDSRNVVRLNDGHGGFGVKLRLPGTGATLGLAPADFDLDGDLDLFEANAGQSPDRVLWNVPGADDSAGAVAGLLLPPRPVPTRRSTGEFRDSGQELGTSNTFAVEAGDIDGDGDIDVIAANRDDEVDQVWLNDGEGRFEPGQQLPGAESWDLKLGDLDRDGDLDLVVGSQPARIWINDGNGRYKDSLYEFPSRATTSVALADLDGDGDPDVATSNTEWSRIWINDGTGRLLDGSGKLGNAITYHSALGDLDNDGDIDLWVTVYNGPNRVWWNDGEAAFRDSGLRLGDGASTFATLTDTDDDGDLDAVVANFDQPNELWINDGQGGFVRSPLSDHRLSTAMVAVADLNGDTIDDMVFANGWHWDRKGPNRIVVNGPDGRSQSSMLRTDETLAVALADFDGDGDLDAFLGNKRGSPDRVLWNRNLNEPPEPALFRESNQRLAARDSSDAAIGDVDGDGDLDAVVTNFSDQPNRVLLNDGQGRFDDSGHNPGAGAIAIDLGDLDGDADPDAFLVQHHGPDEVWLNDGDGHFERTDQRLASTNGRDVALGDLDGDGDIDAFVADFGSPDGLPNRVWFNDGTGHFEDSGQRLGAGRSWDVSLADIDGDADVDALVANLNGPNRIWLNDGRGQFSDVPFGDETQRGSSCIVAGDLDGDADLDLFVTSAYHDNRVWLNDGDGHFQATDQLLTSLVSDHAALADFDHDGDLDVCVASSGNNPNAIWFNDGTGRFDGPVQWLGDQSSVGVQLGDFDGDGDPDAFIVNNFGQPNSVWFNDSTSRAAFKNAQPPRRVQGNAAEPD